MSFGRTRARDRSRGHGSATTLIPVQSGLSLWLESTAGLPTSSGSAATWTDVRGGSYPVATAPGAQPTVNPNGFGTGIATVDFAVGPYMNIPDRASMRINASGITVYVALQSFSEQGNQAIISKLQTVVKEWGLFASDPSAGTPPTFFTADGAATHTAHDTVSLIDSNSAVPGIVSIAPLTHVLCGRYRPSTGKVTIQLDDDVEIVGASAGSIVTSTDVTSIGAYFNGALPANIKLRTMLFYDHELSALENNQVRSYVQSRSGVALLGQSRRIKAGESTTFGQGYNALFQDYPFQYRTLKGLSVGRVVNAGRGGFSWANYLTVRDAYVLPWLRPGMNDRVRWWLGANDIVSGSDVNTITTAALEAVNWTIAHNGIPDFFDILPHEDANAISFNTVRAALNASYETNVKPVVIAAGGKYTKLSADPNIGQDGQNRNLTYYDADQAHLNRVGNALVAAYDAADA